MDGEIGTAELEALLDDDDARVVDIRPPGAYRQGHIPGSENVPFSTLVQNVEAFEGDDRVVTVCPKGESSVKAARLIASYEGFDGRVESYAPGLMQWDGPVESASAETDEGPEAPF